jgi:hypothetical protein
MILVVCLFVGVLVAAGLIHEIQAFAEIRSYEKHKED